MKRFCHCLCTQNFTMKHQSLDQGRDSCTYDCSNYKNGLLSETLVKVVVMPDIDLLLFTLKYKLVRNLPFWDKIKMFK